MMTSSDTRKTTRRLGCAVLLAAAVFTPAALADRVYHSEHLELTPVGAAPLRSGVVQNIKAEGPKVYAHEVYVLNGAVRNAAYTVTRDFFFQDPECDGNLVFHEDVATLETNRSGNGRDNIVVTPEQVAGFEGVHGVMWTIRNSAGALVYQTACTAVTLD
jgi:hypothetical protein